MRKLALILSLAVVVAACGGGGELVATVDDTQITVGEVEALMETNGQTVSKADFARFLAFLIQWRIIFDAAAADYGLEFTEEEVTAEADRIYEEFGEGQSREEFLSERGVTEEFLRNIARQGLIDVAIRERLADEVADPSAEEIEAARAQAEVSLTNACVSHILVETEEEALEILDRLEDGEVFGEIAAELSLDTQSGANNGVLPCGSPAEYDPNFRDAVMVATVGEVHPEPVQSQFGYHVIRVTDRQLPAEEEMPTEEELIESLRDQAVIDALSEWFLAAVAETEVTVEEEFGTWQANPPQVIPPEE